jgi:hypothetical protein
MNKTGYPKSFNGLENIEQLELPNTVYGFSCTYDGHKFFYDGKIVLAKAGELHPTNVLWAAVGEPKWPEGKIITEHERREGLLLYVQIAVETIMRRREEWNAKADAGEHVMPFEDEEGKVYGCKVC